jgi:hypothetical protein
MIRWFFVTAAGLMQHVKNLVRDEHPSRESCYKSSSNACFRRLAASYIAQRP